MHGMVHTSSQYENNPPAAAAQQTAVSEVVSESMLNYIYIYTNKKKTKERTQQTEEHQKQ